MLFLAQGKVIAALVSAQSSQSSTAVHKAAAFPLSLRFWKVQPMANVCGMCLGKMSVICVENTWMFLNRFHLYQWDSLHVIILGWSSHCFHQTCPWIVLRCDESDSLAFNWMRNIHIALKNSFVFLWAASHFYAGKGSLNPSAAETYYFDTSCWQETLSKKLKSFCHKKPILLGNLACWQMFWGGRNIINYL